MADPSNNRISRFTVAVDGTVSFDRAFGMNVDPAGGAGFENGTTTCQAGVASGTAGGMNSPAQLVVDPQGRILVTDRLNNRIDRFTVAGDGTVSFDRAFGVGVDGGAGFGNCTTTCQAGVASADAGGMNSPSGVSVDAQGRILVGDQNNDRIDRFTVAGDGTVGFDRAFGIGVAGGAGFENCTTTCQAGNASGAAGGMNFPAGVAVDAQGRILAADNSNNRIDRFTVAGDGTVSFDRAFGIGVDTGGAGFENCTTGTGCQAGTGSGAAGAMANPIGVAVDAQQRILVGDQNNNRIDRFTVAGDGTVGFDRAFGVGVDTGGTGFENCTTGTGCQIGGAGGAAGAVDNPFGVGVDADGKILVADFLNNGSASSQPGHRHCHERAVACDRPRPLRPACRWGRCSRGRGQRGIRQPRGPGRLGDDRRAGRGRAATLRLRNEHRLRRRTPARHEPHPHERGQRSQLHDHEHPQADPDRRPRRP